MSETYLLEQRMSSKFARRGTNRSGAVHERLSDDSGVVIANAIVSYRSLF
jgi:hypothetical protein